MARLPFPAIPVFAALVWLAAAWQPLAAQRQPISVRSILEEEQIEPGVTTVLQIRIEGAEPEKIPESLSVNGLDIKLSGVERRPPREVNGQMEYVIVAIYAVTGTKIGKFVIPAVDFRFRGEDHSTQSVTLEVIRMSGQLVRISADQAEALALQSAKLEMYVNELVPIEMKVYVRGVNTLGNTTRPEVAGAGNFLIKGFPTEYRRQVEEVDGIPYTTARLPTAVSALSPGDHVLGPAELEAKIGIPATTLPNSPTFPQSKRITSNRLHFKVKPLPAKGKPASFQGAVGRFELQVTATPQKLQVGDPVSIRMQVSGSGNFDSLNSPVLTEQPGWKIYPPTRVESQGLGDSQQMVYYNQVIIPLEDHEELPPIELSYFDAAAEKYVTQNAPAIKLEITPDPALAQRAAIGSLAQVGIASEQLDDILFIHNDAPRWVAANSALVERPGFWLIQLIPALLLVGLLIYETLRNVKDYLASKKAGDELSLSAVRARISGERLSRSAFYRLFLEFCDRWRLEHAGNAARLSGDSRSFVEQICQAGNALLYSGAADVDQPVSAAERKSALKALDEIEALSQAQA